MLYISIDKIDHFAKCKSLANVNFINIAIVRRAKMCVPHFSYFDKEDFEKNLVIVVLPFELNRTSSAMH